jgi:hypothetical protein
VFNELSQSKRLLLKGLQSFKTRFCCTGKIKMSLKGLSRMGRKGKLILRGIEKSRAE